MAFALVGTIGAVSTGAASATVTPAFGTGETRAAGNLLICWVSGAHCSAVPATPAGWSSAKSIIGTVLAAGLFFKVADGADAAPTIASQGGAVWNAQLAEFSGYSGSPLAVDKAGGSAVGATPMALTNATNSPDFTSGELVAYATVAGTALGTETLASSGNNWTPVDVNNNAASVDTHYLFGYGITTTNSPAAKNNVTFNAAVDNAAGVIASFLLIGTIVPFVPQRMPLGV